MNPSAWGEHYWFFLHAVARHYPTHPTAIHRKIHYRLITNFHEFIPHGASATLFRRLLEENPVSPYLDSKKDFMVWTNHVHNLVNVELGKDEVSMADYAKAFEEHYRPKPRKREEMRYLVYFVFVALLFLVAVFMK